MDKFSMDRPAGRGLAMSTGDARCILVVDDEPVVLNLITVLLKNSGYNNWTSGGLEVPWTSICIETARTI